MNELVRLNDNLDILKLNTFKEELTTVLNSARFDNQEFIHVLYNLTSKEIEFRNKRAQLINIHTSNFPFEKTIEDFDFTFQPSLSKNKIIDLTTLRFLETHDNIIFLGLSGTGKTHLATAIGIKAASQRQSTYFISCNDLISNLKKAKLENRLEEKVKQYNKYKLLIIDEVGFLPVTKEDSTLLFQIISKRYENKSTIITTNIAFSKWGEMLGDTALASAILDRLVHHSHIIEIDGPSYRMKGLEEK